MPSRRFALLVATLVVLSGCSAFGGGGGDGSGADDDQTPTQEPPDHHEIAVALAADGDPFEATVTVSRDGETVDERTVESTETVAYRNLTTLDESGPYTISVNTTIPRGKSSTLSERVDVDGDLGNATIISVDKRGISVDAIRLPRRPVAAPLRVRPLWEDSTRFDLNVSVSAWYRGERLGSETVTIPAGQEDPDDVRVETFDLERTGVYHVAARIPKTGTNLDAQGWTNRTVVVTDSDETIVLGTRYVRASVRWIRVMNASRSS